MSPEAGFYYLHENGDLLFKRERPEVEPGGFVRAVWPHDPRDRANAWLIAIEALALGARPARIQELATTWGLTDDDAQIFATRTHQFRLFRDGDQWTAAFHDFVNVQESQVGFGATCLEALAALARPGLTGRTPERLRRGTLPTVPA